MLDYRLVGGVVDEADVEVGIQGGGDFFKFGLLPFVALHFVGKVLPCLTCFFGKLCN